MWPTYNRCRRSWLQGDEDDGNDGDGQAQIILPSQFFLEEQPTRKGGEADYTYILYREQYDIVEAAHGMIDAESGEKVDNTQPDASDGAFPLPF